MIPGLISFFSGLPGFAIRFWLWGRAMISGLSHLQGCLFHDRAVPAFSFALKVSTGGCSLLTQGIFAADRCCRLRSLLAAGAGAYFKGRAFRLRGARCGMVFALGLFAANFGIFPFQSLLGPRPGPVRSQSLCGSRPGLHRPQSPALNTTGSVPSPGLAQIACPAFSACYSSKAASSPVFCSLLPRRLGNSANLKALRHPIEGLLLAAFDDLVKSIGGPRQDQKDGNAERRGGF